MYSTIKYSLATLLTYISLLFIATLQAPPLLAQELVDSFPTEIETRTETENLFIRLSSYELELNNENDLTNKITVETNILAVENIKIENSDFLSVSKLDEQSEYEIKISEDFKNQPITATGKVSFVYEAQNIKAELIVNVDSFTNLIKNTNNLETQYINSCNNNGTRLNLNYIGEWDEQGVPNYLGNNQQVSTDIIQKTNTLLPEKSPVPQVNPNYISGPDKTELKIIKDGEVSITFINEGAGYKNAVGYYTYPVGQRPKDISKIDNLNIIFPNSSKLRSGGGLQAGMTVNLGQFSAGTAIGWFLIPDAWNQSTQSINDCIQPYFSDPDLNPEADPRLRFHNVQILLEESNQILLGFEDLLRQGDNPRSDDDFNDVIFLVNLEIENQIEEDDLVKEPVIDDKLVYQCNPENIWLGTRSTSIESDDSYTIPNILDLEIDPLTLYTYLISTDNKIIRYTDKNLTNPNKGEVIFELTDDLNITNLKFIDKDVLLLSSQKSTDQYILDLKNLTLGLEINTDNSNNTNRISNFSYNFLDNNFYSYTSNSLFKGNLEICNGLSIKGSVRNMDINQSGEVVLISEQNSGRIINRYTINTETCVIDSAQIEVDANTTISAIHPDQCVVSIPATKGNPESQEEQEQENDIPEQEINQVDNEVIEQIFTRNDDTLENGVLGAESEFKIETNLSVTDSIVSEFCARPAIKNINFTSKNADSISRIDYRVSTDSDWQNIKLARGLGTNTVTIDSLELTENQTEIQFRLKNNQNSNWISKVYEISNINNCDGEIIVLNYEFDNGYGEAILTSNREIELNPNLKSRFRVEVSGNIDNLNLLFTDRNGNEYSYPLNYVPQSQLWEVDLDQDIYQQDLYSTSLFIKTDNEDSTQRQTVKLLPNVTVAFQNQFNPNKSGNIDYQIFRKVNQAWEQYNYESIFANSSYNLSLPNNIFKLQAGEYYIKANSSHSQGRTITSDFFTLNKETNVRFDTSKLEENFMQRIFSKVDIELSESDSKRVLASFDSKKEQGIYREENRSELIQESLKKAELKNSVNELYVYYWTRWDKDSSEKLAELIELRKQNNDLVIITDKKNYDQLIRQLRVNYSIDTNENINWVISEDDYDFHFYNAMPNNELIIFTRSTGEITYLNTY